MTDFQIELSDEALDDGSPEERATSGVLVMKADGLLLSGGYNGLTGIHHDGPLVSGYHLAEWLYWNWWRLRHEPIPPVSNTDDWCLSHCLSEVGEGYVWPFITISSDGRRSVIRSDLSQEENALPIRYYGSSRPAALPWSSVEKGIDEFVKTVRERTASHGLGETNLDLLWTDLMTARREPDSARFRRLEALLGSDPDQLPKESFSPHLSGDGVLGEDAIDELAAAAPRMNIDSMLTAANVRELSHNHGTRTRNSDALTLNSASTGVPLDEQSAVEVGVSIARHARRLTGPRDDVMSDRMLTDLAGVPKKVLEPFQVKIPVSISLRGNSGEDHVLLRGARPEIRRHELARLIGDRLIWRDAAVRLSTDSNTYRQKAQRSFATEFLAPAEAVVARADDDYSDDHVDEIAEHFGVSQRIIGRLLELNRMTNRETFDFAEVA